MKRISGAARIALDKLQLQRAVDGPPGAEIAAYIDRCEKARTFIGVVLCPFCTTKRKYAKVYTDDPRALFGEWYRVECPDGHWGELNPEKWQKKIKKGGK